MNVAIRADSSILIGTGHVMRCLTLAEDLVDKGNKVSFICRNFEGNMATYIEEKGYKVYVIPTDEHIGYDLSNKERYEEWLGCPWEQDAEETLSILKELKCVDWLIVDHYSLDVRWELIQREVAKKIAVIDDLADRKHSCDILLDQNLYSDMGSRYEGLVSKTCEQLIGPKYAILRKEFKVEKSNLKKKIGSIDNILIFFGGIDYQNMTAVALKSVININKPEIVVDVVIGKDNPNIDEIKALCVGVPNLTLHVQISYMAKLMANSDLAIGGGGSTNWERMSLGLPSILVALAANQEKVLEDMSRMSLCQYLGKYKNTNIEKMTDAISYMLKHIEKTREMGEKCLNIMGQDNKSISEYLV